MFECWEYTPHTHTHTLATFVLQTVNPLGGYIEGFSKSYLIGWLFDKLVLNGMQNENIIGIRWEQEW